MSTLGIQHAVWLGVKRKVETCMGLRERYQILTRKWGNAMYFAGVDIAKRRHELCVIDDSGDILLQLPVERTPNVALKSLLTAFSNQAID